MENLTNIEELKRIIDRDKLSLIYATTDNCSVCKADLPRIETLEENMKIAVYRLRLEEMPLARGFLNLFSAPGVLLFYKGKELLREVGFINFTELKGKIEKINKLINKK